MKACFRWGAIFDEIPSPISGLGINTAAKPSSVGPNLPTRARAAIEMNDPTACTAASEDRISGPELRW